MKSLKHRRRLLVDKRLQFRFAIFCVGYLVVSHFLLSVWLYGPLIKKLNDPNSTGAQLLEAATHVLYLHGHYWPIIILSIFVVSLPVIYLSRRFVGPLTRFMTVLQQVRDGQIPKPFSLRKHDYLEAELEVINGMLEELRFRLGSIQEDQIELQNLLQKLDASIPEQDRSQIAALSQNAMELSADLGRKIDHFEMER